MKKDFCRKFKYGYCKYKDKCHFRHNTTMCTDNNCKVFDCEKRHPRTCSYFKEYRRCKFTTFCLFKHQTGNDLNDIIEKMKKNEKELNEIEHKLKKLSDVEKKLEAFEKENQEMYANLEGQLKGLAKRFDEKETQIAILEKRLEQTENKLAKQIQEKNKHIKSLDNKVQNLENKLEVKTTEQKEDKMKCEHCDFTTNSSQGLKVHLKRKHTNYSEETKPGNCEICNRKFEDLRGKPWDTSEIESHMITHSYRSSGNLNYKCDECDFWGPNSLTMEIHVKKLHSEKIKCGLCASEFLDLGSIDTHLQTCESYKCIECGKVFKQLEDVKEHVRNLHEGKNISIIHTKSDRNISEYFDNKMYNMKELFGKKK